MWRCFLLVLAVTAACERPNPRPSLARLPSRPAYVDSGACPFECCHYGRWKADTTVALRASPDSSSRMVATLSAGDSADAPTGFVRTVPTPLIVTKNARQLSNGTYLYRPGDTLWAYTYLGEGHYRMRRDTGAFFDEGVDPGPIVGVQRTAAECKADSLCWAVFTPPTETVWWVKVQTRSGVVGWTAEADLFGGKDACSSR